MNELRIFESEEFGKLTTIVINEETWFIGKEVVVALGYADLTHAVLDHVYEEDRMNSKTVGLNAPEFGQRGTWLINESGLYSLVFGSQLQKARNFKRWVTSEILPTLRKTGTYSIKQRIDSYTIEDPAERARRWAEEYEEKVKLERQVAGLHSQVQEMMPKAGYFDAICDARLLTNFRDAAKEIGMSQTQFTGYLKANGYVYTTSKGELRPTEPYRASDLFQMKSYVNPNNGFTGIRTYLTPKGIQYFKLQFEANELIPEALPKHGGRKEKNKRG